MTNPSTALPLADPYASYIKRELEINRTGDLSDQQFGFTEGKHTVDAIKIIKIAEANFPHKQRNTCAMITLDIKNAFSSASWDLIYEEH